jgi:2-polyprenyl-3-methyl-5-hydroxy-6-metoxy-1,4-benzoquinol methylase
MEFHRMSSSLRVVAVSQKEKGGAAIAGTVPSRTLRQQETRARLEREWLIDPKQGDLDRSVTDQQRIDRILEMVNHCSGNELSNKLIIDLGCGSGALARRLRQAGANVHAVDGSENALKEFRKRGCDGIDIRVEVLPETSLPDKTYDIVVCADVVAELDVRDHRLLMSELARIVKPDGWVVCATPVDVHSEDAVQRFKSLFATEFDLLGGSYSYHRLALRWGEWIPLIKRSGWCVRQLERLSQSLWQQEAISDLILVGQRRKFGK